MVDNYFKPKGGVQFDGYSSTPPTQSGSLGYDGYSGRLQFLDGYGSLKKMAFTDDTNIIGNHFNSSRIILNYTNPVSQADNAGIVIQYGTSSGDPLFGEVLFTGQYNPSILFDTGTNSWFIGRGDGYGLRIGQDAYGTTLTPNYGTGTTIRQGLTLPDLGPVAGYVLKTDGYGHATWQTDTGFTDPMTTIGDMVYRNGSNITSRLPVGSSGQVLTITAGVPSWQPAPSGTAIGSAISGGTNGSVLFVGSGSLTQDNTNFFWDDTNNYLGLGTNTPAGPLDVRPASGAFVGPIFRVRDNGGTEAIRINSNTEISFTSGSVNGSSNFITINPGTDTNVNSDSNSIKVNSNTLSLNAGYVNQRFSFFNQSIITSGAANTVTNASTMSLAGTPRATSSALITNAAALRIESGTALTTSVTNAYGLYVDAPTGATINIAALFTGVTSVAYAGSASDIPFQVSAPSSHNNYIATFITNTTTAGGGIFINATSPSANGELLTVTNSGNARSAVIQSLKASSTSPTIELKHSNPATATIRLSGATSGQVDIKVPAAPTSYAVTLPSAQGVIGSSLLNDGSGILSWTTWQSKISAYTAVAGDKLLADTSGGVFSITLPASPTIGQSVIIMDAAGTWGTNNLTVLRNSSNINGAASDFTANISGSWVEFVYYNAGQGWRLRL